MTCKPCHGCVAAILVGLFAAWTAPSAGQDPSASESWEEFAAGDEPQDDVLWELRPYRIQLTLASDLPLSSEQVLRWQRSLWQAKQAQVGARWQLRMRFDDRPALRDALRALGRMPDGSGTDRVLDAAMNRAADKSLFAVLTCRGGEVGIELYGYDHALRSWLPAVFRTLDGTSDYGRATLWAAVQGLGNLGLVSDPQAGRSEPPATGPVPPATSPPDHVPSGASQADTSRSDTPQSEAPSRSTLRVRLRGSQVPLRNANLEPLPVGAVGVLRKVGRDLPIGQWTYAVVTRRGTDDAECRLVGRSPAWLERGDIHAEQWMVVELPAPHSGTRVTLWDGSEPGSRRPLGGLDLRLVGEDGTLLHEAGRTDGHGRGWLPRQGGQLVWLQIVLAGQVCEEVPLVPGHTPLLDLEVNLPPERLAWAREMAACRLEAASILASRLAAQAHADALRKAGQTAEADRSWNAWQQEEQQRTAELEQRLRSQPGGGTKIPPL